MIDKTEYEFIDLLLKNSKFDEKIYNFEIRSLLNDGYIEPNLFEKEDGTFVNLGYFVTPFGKRAFEKYSSYIEEIKISQDALTASKEANQISERSNYIANKSKNLSIFAIIVSLVALAFTAADFIVALLGE